MRLSISSLIAGLTLATTAAADSMYLQTYCFTLACTSNGYFITAFGRYDVDGDNGCRQTSVPGMIEFCIDEKRERMHFKFQGQEKRCMKVFDSEWALCSDDNKFATCSSTSWDEVPCDW